MASIPLASVVMPVYNAERYVREAVASILRQTFSDFEFLILDDGSTDGTVEILRSFDDSRIRLACSAHAGIVAMLNAGLIEARGEFIARMDADDIAEPDRLRVQVDFLARHSEVVAVGGKANIIDPDGDPIEPYDVPMEHGEIDAQHLSGYGGRIPHPAAMFRRSALVQAGMYEPDMHPAEDLDLFLRLAEIGRLANVPECVLRYRWHLRSVSATSMVQQRRAAYRAVREACRRRGIPVVEWPEDDTSIMTASEQRSLWVAKAVAAGNVKTARKWARRLLREEPHNARNWRLLSTTVPLLRTSVLRVRSVIAQFRPAARP